MTQKELNKIYKSTVEREEDGHDGFLKPLRKYGFKVLVDPASEGTDFWGFVIIPPKNNETNK